MKKYKCSCTYEDGETAAWESTVTLVRATKDQVEADIEGRGSSFRAVIGSYQYGHFICIPTIDVGCPLAGWNDVFWNRERLSKQMNITDAVTVAYGIKTIMLELEKKRNRGMER